MKYGRIDLQDAENTILAHSLKVGDRKLSKGHLINAQDLEELAAAGLTSLVAARLDEDDVPENEAAERVAAAMLEGHLRPTIATTGRMNICSTVAGLFIADRGAVDRFNRIDPAITLACLADRVPVRQGEIVATIKIIPYAVPRRSVERVQSLTAQAAPFRVKPFAPFSTALIATMSPSLKEQTMNKTRAALAERLSGLGSSLDREWRVEHEDEALAAAIRAAGRDHDLIVIFGASAVTDSDDVVPTAIRRAGGRVEHIGMPVDPGNLFLLASLNAVPVVGAPGCARTPRQNGLDLVLPRILAGEVLTSWDITGLGVGGLLAKQSPVKPD